MKLTIFDLINITIFLSSAFLGVYIGFIRTLINLLAFIITIFGTIELFPHTHHFAAKYIVNELAQTIFAALISYIIILIVTSITKYYIFKFIAFTKGNALDRMLGLIIGALRGILICLIIFWIAIIFSSKNMIHGEKVNDVLKIFNKEDYPTWFKESETYDLTVQANDIAFDLIPDQILYYKLSKIGIHKMFKASNSKKEDHNNLDSLEQEILNNYHDLDQELKHNEHPKKEIENEPENELKNDFDDQIEQLEVQP